jgi:hypothetical protein
MRSHVSSVLTLLSVVALGGSPAAGRDHCRPHGCADCAGAAGHGSGCPDCVAGSARASDPTQADRPAAPVYDPDSVTTLRGTVTGVAVVPAQGGRSGGTHVTLESDGAAMEVHLGPTWFLEREGVRLSKGEALEVTGSVVNSGGATFLVAREIKTVARVLALRDERGVPLWARAARRP